MLIGARETPRDARHRRCIRPTPVVAQASDGLRTGSVKVFGRVPP
jgi:hypothetical protein